ncbi:MAG: Stk1 family PASTA domain-containing Ser/Thr kinase [Clostridiales bacterium]|nr:Stk1 family PASTA domain-containing Ser/Thr kinase [Clostridiales bacterium]
MIKPGMFISERYEIIDKVGSGGMADVYKAKCHRLNRYVAIKILKPEYSSDKNFVAKFRGEAQSVAGLSHPNVVNVYDVGEDEGLYYIVMELVEGITLKRFIERKGRLEIKEAVGIAIQIAQGMEAAHENHIIHRDIKPQNIIISRDGKVKVTDFGIAKAVSTNTVTQNAIGSVHYLSPEQARGGYSDEKSDIYSLGVTIYEMLSGEVPFAGDNSVSVALLHIQGEATPLRELNPDVPVSVEKIVQKCMQKKPERRYLSAADLIADLKRSIINKDGDYVVISNGVVSDSPTIALTDDEMSHIKSAAKTPITTYDNSIKEPNMSKVPKEKEEEEELDTVDSKVEKVLLIGMIVAAVLLGGTVLFIVSKFLHVLPEPNKDVTPTPIVSGELTPTPTVAVEQTGDVIVPDVVNLTRDEARDALQAVSKTFTILYAPEEEYDDTIPAGSIMKQDPEANTEVANNATITLTISAGPEAIPLPDVYNRSYTLAKQQLEELGFVVNAVYEESNDLEKDMVIRTEPARTTDPTKPVLAPKGSTVTVVVSSGANVQTVAVPDISGMTETEAKAELEKYGLVLGEKSFLYSTKYAQGLVCLQSYTIGQSVPVGTKINYSVSLGPEVTATPTPEPTQEPEDEVTPTPEPDIDEPEEPDDNTVYSGTVSITQNPFDVDQSGTIYLELDQNGEKTSIIEKTSSYDTFTKDFANIRVEGEEGRGIVSMFVNDVVYPETWEVYLTAEN